mgnify:CR=1 FL=1
MSKKRSEKRSSLFRKLSISVIFPVLTIILIIGSLTVVMLNVSTKESIEHGSNSALQMVQSMLEAEIRGVGSSYLQGRAEAAVGLAQMFYQQEAAGRLSHEEALSGLAELILSPGFNTIGDTGYLAIIDMNGVLMIHPRSQGVNASGFEFMQKAIQMREGYLEYDWQNRDEEAPQKKATYISYFEPWNVMIWATTTASDFLYMLDRTALNQRIDEITIDESGYVFLLDTSCEINAGTDPLHIHTQLQAMDTSSGGVQAFTLATDEGDVRVVLSTEDFSGWTIAIVTPMEYYYRQQQSIMFSVLTAIVISGILIFLLLRIIVKHSLQPISYMQKIVDQVSNGDLTGSIPVYTDDEIGDVAEMFNQLLTEFSSTLLRVHSAIKTLGNSVTNLSKNTQETASSSNEQAAAIKEVLTTMEDADHLSKSVETKIQEVARIANHTKENVEQGFSLIQSSLSKMDEIRSTNADTISGIKALGDRIESIWDIVNIINGIADQTKIIAFNAELEAAAAGEAGKNFQIVAGEIRRLADSTVESTNEIKIKITEIQHASDKLILASEDGTQRIREGWEVSTNIRGVFEDVLSSSEVSANSASEISHSMNMQVSSFEQVFITLKNISEVIDSFVELVAQSSEVTDQLQDISRSFSALITGYTLEENQNG